MTDAERHIPVFVDEAMAFILPRAGGLYVDGTVGDGGHSRTLLERSAPDGRVVGFDRDAEALGRARANLADLADAVVANDDEDAHLVEAGSLAKARLVFFHRNYSRIAQSLAQAELGGADGLLLDLGVSTLQLMADARGFSFRGDGPLDMRMNARDDEPTAKELIGELDEEGLEAILSNYGEERFARRIARSILRARDDGELETTQQLASAVVRTLPPANRYGHVHPATRTFQALRIAVNRELEHLEKFLSTFVAALGPGGTCVVLTYHSLEDRLVKHAFRGAHKRGEVIDLTKRPLVPSEAEVLRNARARCAKLRAVRRAA